MNILGLVFSLLLILSYTFYACWDKQTASSRLRTTYRGHEIVHRKILNKYASEVYDQLTRKSKAPNPDEDEIYEEHEVSPKKATVPDFNHTCSKLNLYPLIQEGRENHPLLYELAARLIRLFYAPLSTEKRFEYHILNSLLASAKAFPPDTPFAFEKLLLDDYQRIYYKMLKGTKQWHLPTNQGYPPLLDYIKSHPSHEKICLSHAHPDLLTVVFNESIATTLYPLIHQQDGPALTPELIRTLFSDAHQLEPDPALLLLLEYGHPNHSDPYRTLVAQDSNICLRQKVYLPKDEISK
jgi:hypothetical protein